MKLRVRDLVVGSTASGELLVKSGQIKQTRGGKPYLLAELFDGTDSIQANDWEYGNNPAPAANTVLTIEAQVTEWAGNKQLNIKSQIVCGTMSSGDFAPVSNVNIKDYAAKASELIGELEPVPMLQEVVRAIYNDNASLIKVVPAAKGIHHAYVGGTLKHQVDVALKARALALCNHEVSKELCIAGGLLHDIGKLTTYELKGAIIDYTDDGTLKEHIAIGYSMLEKYRTDANSAIIDLLQHIILSHHGELEYGSPVTPRFTEAWFVHLADMADAKAETIHELNSKALPNAKYTEKEWSLNNRTVVTQAYINQVLMGYDD